MAAPSTNNTTAAADNATVTINVPLTAAASTAAAAGAASNVWPNTRDNYELREVIGNHIRHTRRAHCIVFDHSVVVLCARFFS